MNANQTFIDIHGCRIVSTMDDAGLHGWTHELFDGASLGQFPTLGDAIAAAKLRHPPEAPRQLTEETEPEGQ